MATVNERLLDANIGRHADLMRYANGLVRKVVSTLNRADSDLFSKLTDAIERTGPDSPTVDRLENQLASVRAMNAALYKRVEQGISTDLRDLTQDELGFQGQLLEQVPPVRVPFVALPPDQVYAAVLARPFQGRLLSEWAESIGESRMVRIRDAVRMGFLNGETTAQIVQRIRGTRAKGYSDGIITIDRRNAEAVVRTAVGHTASVAKSMLYEANADLVKAVQWVSTLDTRTSEICRARDGLHYTCDTHKPIGHSKPWLGGPGQAHWNCRSTSVPVLKSLRELGIDAPDLPPGMRASMDGAVPANTTYGAWFARQSPERQDSIVGPERGKLFRAGKVSFDQFTNDKGRWLTIEQLRRSSRSG